jgi:predicted O-linked N-acetylglucosamine transferase (SPINDLY family)
LPDSAELARAIALYQAGNRAAAAAQAEEILRAHCPHPDALNLLAVIAIDEQRFAAAQDLARRAIVLAPGDAIYHNTLGNALLAQGRSGESIASFVAAVGAAPGNVDILFNLANAQVRGGEDVAAMASYRRCIALKADHIPAYNNLALVLKNRGDVAGAAAVLADAVARAPAAPELHFNLGNALQALGRLAEAETAYRRAIELKPTHADAHVNLGVVLAEQERRAEAEAHFRRAIALNPDIAQAYVGLADLIDDGGMDAVAHRRAVLALKPDLAAVRSSLLMCLHYDPRASRAEIFAEHKAYGAMFPKAPPLFAPDQDFNPERRLRLGVVSGDFRFHAMAFFALPVFAIRDQAAWHLTCYACAPRSDEHTRAFRDTADAWRDVYALPPAHVADLIARDRIDVLIDLSGHAPRNGLPVFALRPAPLQVAWGDYVDTRGLAAIDVLLGDEIHTPPKDDRYYVERVARFAPDYVCYRPPPYAPPVADAPCVGNGFVTFACFSEATKIGAESIARWAACLKAVPRSRFLLNNHMFADHARRARIVGWFGDAGIAADRLSFREGGPHAEFLAQYALADIILDTTPYSGGLTTCEALLMGVPVLTVPGDRFCGRHAAAHLTHGGFPEGVCASREDLVATAVRLAADFNALAKLRGQLRQRFEASALRNELRFAEAFYGALRNAWRGCHTVSQTGHN